MVSRLVAPYQGRGEAERITIVRPREAEVEIRSLADYDTALGLTEAAR